jgi:hypothetical protein
MFEIFIRLIIFSATPMKNSKYGLDTFLPEGFEIVGNWRMSSAAATCAFFRLYRIVASADFTVNSPNDRESRLAKID